MNKKNVSRFVALNVLGSMLLSPTVMAGISSSRTSSSGGSVSSGSTSATITTKPGRAIEEKVEMREGTASVACKQDPDASTYFPLDFFKHITSDGSLISFETRPDNKIVVKIPPSLDACGKFKPQLIQSKDNMENVVIAMTLDNGKTYGQYIKCLEESKYLVDGKINHDNIPGKEYSEYSYVLDYNFDKKKDIKKTLKLSYGYPKAFAGKDGYTAPFGIDESVTLPSSLCMQGEKIAATPTLLNEGQDALVAKLTEICKHGDAQEIADARRSIGNAEALSDIADKLRAELDSGYLVAVQKDVKKIYEAMDALDEKINSESSTIDEKSAKELVRKYDVLAQKLEEIYYGPAIKRLDELMTSRTAAETDKDRGAIDLEIKKLNEGIGEFAKRSEVSFPNLKNIMEKYAINEPAKSIVSVRMKSRIYSQVFIGNRSDSRGVPFTFERAAKYHANEMKNFSYTLNDWTDVYQAGHGNNSPFPRVKKEYTDLVTKRDAAWNDFQQQATAEFNKYCSAGFTGQQINPVRCSEFQKTIVDRRAAAKARYDEDGKAINARLGKLNKMGMDYTAYGRQVAAERADGTRSSGDYRSEFSQYGSDYSQYGSSYSGYETNFVDAYPQYRAPASGYTGYEAWKNSLPQPGQQGQQFQQQQYYNPQAPVQQGQFYNQIGIR